jgi:putative SOS response-associated peptidase YedK
VIPERRLRWRCRVSTRPAPDPPSKAFLQKCGWWRAAWSLCRLSRDSPRCLLCAIHGRMCGRFVRTSPQAVLVDEFDVEHFVNVDFAPRYNIAPRQPVETIINDGKELRMGPLTWGYTTSAADKTRPAPINARAETIATMPLFREAFRRRRCLVVADGFYEWQKDGNTKTPYFIRLRSARPFGFAAIWSSMRGAMGQRVGTCAILTCAPNELMAPIHNRMPVILPKAVRDRWLDPTADAGELQALLTPFPPGEMEAYAVSTLVNSPRNDTPECIVPVVG